MLGAVIGAVAAPLIGSAVGNIFGGTTSAQGQTQGAQAQVGGLQNAANALQQYYGTAGNALTNAYNTATGTLQPYAGLGLTPLNQLINSGYLTNQFSNADLNAQLAPNYAFQLGQGQQANLMGSNVTGGAVGGNAATALQQYTQNYAQNAYQNAFTNYQTQRQNIIGNARNIAAMGQAGSNALASLQSGYGTSQANLNTALGNALASNYGQQGSALGAGITGAANTMGNMYSNVGTTLGTLGGNLFSGNAPQTSQDYMNSIGAGGSDMQYFGANTSGQGAGLSGDMLSMLGLG
jgi:hypothetical protein